MKYTYKHTRNACYLGLATQAVINNLAPLLFILFQDEFGISYEKIGRLILINFLTQLAVDLLAAKFADKMGYRLTMCLAHIFCAAGLVSLGVLPKLMPSPYLGLVISVVIYAIGGGMLEVQVSPLVNSIPSSGEKSSSMSLLHSFYCWGQVVVVLVTTLLLRFLGNGIWPFIPPLWAIMPLYNLYRCFKIPYPEPVAESEKTPARVLFRSGIFRIALILMLCAGAAELTMSQWSSLFAERGLGVPKVLGDLLGPCLFAVLMGVGRTLYGVLGHRLHLKRVLLLCGGLCVLCYLAAAFSRNPVLALAGCALCGFSVSLMWPGTFSLSAEYYPNGGTSMFAFLAVFGDLGCAVGPWMAGLVSDAVQRAQAAAVPLETAESIGLRSGLLLGTIFPVLLLIGLLFLRQRKEASA